MRVSLRFTILAVSAMIFFPVIVFIYVVEAHTSPKVIADGELFGFLKFLLYKSIKKIINNFWKKNFDT